MAFRSILRFFEPTPVDEEGPIVIGWAGPPALRFDEIVHEVRDSQTFFGLIPSFHIQDHSSLQAYCDKTTYVKIWFENPDFLNSYLPPDRYSRLPFRIDSCIVMQDCHYDKKSLPIDDPNYRRKDLCDSISEHFWDRLIYRFQKLTDGILIIDDEGINNLDGSINEHW